MNPLSFALGVVYLIVALGGTAILYALTKSSRVCKIVFVVVTWPVWMPFVWSALGPLPCKLEAPGFVTYGPHAVHRLALREDAAVPATRGWPFESAFIEDCQRGCADALNHYFAGFPDDVRIEEAPFSFEVSWRFRAVDDPAHRRDRHARLWIAAADAPRCLAPLDRRHRYSRRRTEDLPHCIAGIEIPRITAPFVVDLEPFEKRSTGRRGPTRTDTTAVRYLPFVRRTEQRLYHAGQLAARYQAFWWQTRWMLIEHQSTGASCPVEEYRTYDLSSRFWHALFEDAVVDAARADAGSS